MYLPKRLQSLCHLHHRFEQVAAQRHILILPMPILFLELGEDLASFQLLLRNKAPAHIATNNRINKDREKAEPERERERAPACGQLDDADFTGPTMICFWSSISPMHARRRAAASSSVRTPPIINRTSDSFALPLCVRVRQIVRAYPVLTTTPFQIDY